MKTENYIIVASDNNNTVSRIVEELDTILGYSSITINSVKLIKQLLFSITPKLIIFNFKNNNLELNQLFNTNENITTPILCLTNKYEKISCISEKNQVIIQSLENSLQNNHLLYNVKSILSISKIREVNSLEKRSNGGSFISENKNLTRYVLELDQKKALLKSMMERIKELTNSVDHVTRSRLNSIINNIKLDTSTNHWDDFKVYFENVNPGFIHELSCKFPCLTSKDIKYCCYLKMNMSNEDIRYILGINKESVRTHKYRLKKKMTLQKEQDLKKYINSF